MQAQNSAFKNLLTSIYKKYGDNPARMLIYTGVLGWFLSSAAQVVAIMANKDIPKEAKLFMIPQEIGDGAVNVLSFFAITSVIKALGSKLVSTGKLITPSIKNFLKKNNFNTKKGIGNVKFDIGQVFSRQDIINGSKEYRDYKDFKSGVEVAAMTVGSIISCNIVTPIFRNKIAEKRQKTSLARLNYENTKAVQAPRGISIDAYRNMASSKFSGGLKI